MPKRKTLTIHEPEPQQPIQLHFSLGADVSSRLIAWWGYGYGGYSHVDAILSDGSLCGARSDHAGGQAPGVRVRKPFYEAWKKSAVLTIPATVHEHDVWETWQRDQCGDRYDSADILGLIIGKPLNEGAGHWICSADQITGLQVVQKIPALLPFAAQQTTPNTLFMLGAALPGATFELFGPTDAA